MDTKMTSSYKCIKSEKDVSIIPNSHPLILNSKLIAEKNTVHPNSKSEAAKVKEDTADSRHQDREERSFQKVLETKAELQRKISHRLPKRKEF